MASKGWIWLERRGCARKFGRVKKLTDLSLLRRQRKLLGSYEGVEMLAGLVERHGSSQPTQMNREFMNQYMGSVLFFAVEK